MKDQKKRDWPSIVMLAALGASVVVTFTLWLQFRLHPTPEAFFAYCVAVVGVAFIATIRALAATMRRRPFAVQVGDWAVAVLVLSVLIDLFAITTLGHRVLWEWLPRIP